MGLGHAEALGQLHGVRGAQELRRGAQELHHLPELVADVGLVRVEEQEHAVRVLREPADDGLVVVAAAPLLLTWSGAGLALRARPRARLVTVEHALALALGP